jgi:hypothetical protein
VSFFQRVHMPSLDAAAGWLNSEPLPSHSGDDRPSRALAGLVAVALVGLVVCLVTDEIG